MVNSPDWQVTPFVERASEIHVRTPITKRNYEHRHSTRLISRRTERHLFRRETGCAVLPTHRQGSVIRRTQAGLTETPRTDEGADRAPRQSFRDPGETRRRKNL